MSRLLVYTESAPDEVRVDTSDPEEIARELARDGVRFERWSTPVALADDASSEAILAAYADAIERLQREGGYRAADVVRLRRDPADAGWDDKARAARARFLSEHRHDEDEVRFFVEGAGLFALRIGGRVHLVRCERGDLLSVPAGTRHWFDMGTEPAFCAIRLFGSPAGWEARFTGDAIAERFPDFDAVARRLS